MENQRQEIQAVDEGSGEKQIFQKINEVKEENKLIKKQYNDLKADNQLIKKLYEDLNKEFKKLKNKNEDLKDNLDENEQLINIQNENLLNDIQPARNNFEFFKRNKILIIFLFCLFLIILIIFIYSLIKFNSISNKINDNEIYNIEKFNNIATRIDDIEVYYPTNNTIISFVNKGIKKSLNREITSIKLLYNALLNGDSATEFHKKCDGYNNTLTIIKTDNGKIFGGFTRLSWESEKKGKEDDKGFVFSYDTKEIYYRNTTEKIEIRTHPDYGPIFGAWNLKIDDNCLHNTNSYDSTGTLVSSYDTNGQKYALNGDEHFKVYNYMVYELLFE